MTRYYLTKRYAALYTLLLIFENIVILGFFAYLAIKTGSGCLLLLVLVCGIVSILFILNKIIYEQIIVSENGIEYWSPGLGFDATWNSIEKIYYHWYDGWRIECLLIDNAQIRISKWTFPARSLPTPLVPFSQKTIIPLSCFSDNWRESELGQQIKQYAPRFFP